MKTTDLTTITAVGVLTAALVVFLAGVGITVPLWIPACVPLATGLIIFSLRAYVAFVGADNTTVDERLELAIKLVESVRKMRDTTPAALPTAKAIDEWIAKESPTKKEPTKP